MRVVVLALVAILASADAVGTNSTTTITTNRANVLTTSGFCSEKEHCNGDWNLQGTTANGSPYYKRQGVNIYMYYDECCDGSGTCAVGRWICDASVPDVAKVRDLDNDAKCTYNGRLSTNIKSEVPSGGSWKVHCKDWTYNIVTVQSQGSSCANWLHMPSKHVFGHNNKQLTGVTVEECKSACCAATSFTCRSFDYHIGQSKCDLSDTTGDMVGGLGRNSNQYDNYEIGQASYTTINPSTGGCPTGNDLSESECASLNGASFGGLTVNYNSAGT
jgi:hypothetical protein